MSSKLSTIVKRNGLLVIHLTCVVGLAAIGGKLWSTTHSILIGGPRYLAIAENDDLAAEIPRFNESILEMVLAAYQLRDEKSPEKQDDLISRIESLGKKIESRRQFWEGTLTDKTMKARIAGDTFAATKSLEAVATEYVSAIRSRNLYLANSILTGEFMRLVQDHRVSMTTLGLSVAEHNTVLLEESHRASQSIPIFFALIGSGILGLSGLSCIVWSKQNQRIRQLALRHKFTLEDSTQTLSRVTTESTRFATALAEIASINQQLNATTDTATEHTATVIRSSDAVSQSIQTVASSIEEMQKSICDISHNAGDAARVANEAVQMTSHTNSLISKLGERSADIGNVVKVINSIARQTNLLALNANIEAARAGEAGKGFAVVANEVKELAKETAKATADISQRIEAIQSDTSAAVQAISQIGGIIVQVNDISSTIASAVEQQTTTTQQISQNVDEAARNSLAISASVAEMSGTLQHVTQGVNATLVATRELEKLATNLQEACEWRGDTLAATPGPALEDEILENCQALLDETKATVGRSEQVASTRGNLATCR